MIPGILRPNICLICQKPIATRSNVFHIKAAHEVLTSPRMEVFQHLCRAQTTPFWRCAHSLMTLDLV